MTCEHRLPDHPVIVDLRPTPHACIFCRIKELEAERDKLRELLGDIRFYLQRSGVDFGNGRPPASQWSLCSPALRERVAEAIGKAE